MKFENKFNKIHNILGIIYISFFIGTLYGCVYVAKNQVYYPTVEYFNAVDSFVNMAKFIIVPWFIGMLPIGIFFLPPIIAFCGYTYGFQAVSLFILKDFNYIFILKNIFFTGSIILIGVFGMCFSFNFYQHSKNPKSNLPRERKKLFVEYVIILLGALIIVAIGAILDTKL